MCLLGVLLMTIHVCLAKFPKTEFLGVWMGFSSINDQKIQIRLTWKLLIRSWENFHRVYIPWRGLRGWFTMSNNKSKMADSGHLLIWITSSTLELHCCKAHAKIYRKVEKSRTVALILTLNILNVVFPPQDCAFRVQVDEWRHTGKIRPQNFPKSGVNWQF